MTIKWQSLQLICCNPVDEKHFCIVLTDFSQTDLQQHAPTVCVVPVFSIWMSLRLTNLFLDFFPPPYSHIFQTWREIETQEAFDPDRQWSGCPLICVKKNLETMWGVFSVRFPILATPENHHRYNAVDPSVRQTLVVLGTVSQHLTVRLSRKAVHYDG